MLKDHRYLKLLFSAGGGQLIGISASFLVPFLYSPEKVGVYGIFLSVNRIFSAIASGNLEGLVYLTSNSERRIHLLVLPLRFLLGVALVLCILVVSFSDFLNTLFQLAPGTSIWWFIPLMVLLQGTIQVAGSFFNAEKNERDLHTLQITQSALPGIGKVSLFKFGAMGLVVGHFAGLFIAFLRAVTRLPLELWSALWKKGYGVYFQRYKSWWSWGIPSALINLFGLEALFLYTQHGVGVVFTGILTLGFRYVKMPLELLNGALSKELLSDGSGLGTEALRSVVLRSIRRQVKWSLPFLVIVFFGAEPIVEGIWGEEWRDAGRLAKTVAPFLFVHGIGSMIAPLADLLGKLRTEFIFMTLLTAVRVVVLVLFWDSWWEAVHWFFMFSIAVWVAYIVVMLSWLKKK